MSVILFFNNNILLNYYYIILKLKEKNYHIINQVFTLYIYIFRNKSIMKKNMIYSVHIGCASSKKF